MTEIERYIDLSFRIEISDFKINLHAKHPDENEELVAEQKNNEVLRNELSALINLLSEKSGIADEIRVSFIHVANGILNSFAQIKKWGGMYYPDLSQSMVIPGYLLGMILEDFKIALKYEGGHPVVTIHMSAKEWDYGPLQSLIQSIRDELIKSNFACKMDAINYYEHIKKSMLVIINDLRGKGLI